MIIIKIMPKTTEAKMLEEKKIVYTIATTSKKIVGKYARLTWAAIPRPMINKEKPKIIFGN